MVNCRSFVFSYCSPLSLFLSLFSNRGVREDGSLRADSVQGTRAQELRRQRFVSFPTPLLPHLTVLKGNGQSRNFHRSIRAAEPGPAFLSNPVSVFLRFGLRLAIGPDVKSDPSGSVPTLGFKSITRTTSCLEDMDMEIDCQKSSV